MAVSKKKVKKATAKKKPGRELSPVHKRAVHNKKLNQQALREKLSTANHIGRIGTCLKRLEAINAQVARKQGLEREEQAKYITEVGVLKTRLDAHFKLLNKFLPDLRSIDFQTEDGENPLEAAISAWSRALPKGPTNGSSN